jgi:hypothetical protein
VRYLRSRGRGRTTGSASDGKEETGRKGGGRSVGLPPDATGMRAPAINLLRAA